tara:strand:- start:31869 stop:32168 length:300 start_codon:yes stop_codon:yes gene_type:complete
MEDIEIFLPWRNPTYKEKIIIPSSDTIVSRIDLPKFEINQKEFLIDEKYRFIDIDKLLKLNNKKYEVKELKEIASKLGISINNKKLELVRLIKLKIGLE